MSSPLMNANRLMVQVPESFLKEGEIKLIALGGGLEVRKIVRSGNHIGTVLGDPDDIKPPPVNVILKDDFVGVCVICLVKKIVGQLLSGQRYRGSPAFPDRSALSLQKVNRPSGVVQPSTSVFESCQGSRIS